MKNYSKYLLTFVLGIIVSFTMNIAAEIILSSEQISYTNSKTEETTVEGSLNELFSAVDINERLGDITKISSVGDGTVSGAISSLNSDLGKIGEFYSASASMTYDTAWNNTTMVSIKISEPGVYVIKGSISANVAWNANGCISVPGAMANFVPTPGYYFNQSVASILKIDKETNIFLNLSSDATMTTSKLNVSLVAVRIK